jgi:acetylornithine deacetylase/succinyl-diaminopimelate desuccinylase-like protein
MARKAGRISLLIILGILICAAQIHAQAVPTQIAAPPSTDLSKLDTDALQWLQDLLRINTANPTGNEQAAAKYVSGVLQNEGIASETYESAPGRGFLAARLSSSAVPDPSRALLLVAHLDAAPADKNILAANLAVFIELKRSGARLNRDVILLVQGDEEGGGETGMKFATEKYWDKIAAGYALSDGGRVVLKDGKIRYVAVQASEKTQVSVDIIAKGASASASVPAADNAIVHLASAIEKIAAYEAPVQFNTVTSAYFEGLAAAEDEDTAKWMRALESSDRADHAARWISSANPAWGAMLRDTICPAALQAGKLPGVVPAEARATLDIGLLPGNFVDPLLAKLRELVNDPQVRFEEAPGATETAPSSSLPSSLYTTISNVAAQQFPGAAIVPMMSPEATDSTPLRMRGVQTYGLVPFPLTEDALARIHSADQSIPSDSFRQGIQFLYGIVESFAAAR